MEVAAASVPRKMAVVATDTGSRLEFSEQVQCARNEGIDEVAGVCFKKGSQKLFVEPAMAAGKKRGAKFSLWIAYSNANVQKYLCEALFP